MGLIEISEFNFVLPSRTASTPFPFSKNPKSSVSTTSAIVKQSCTSAKSMSFAVILPSCMLLQLQSLYLELLLDVHVLVMQQVIHLYQNQLLQYNHHHFFCKLFRTKNYRACTIREWTAIIKFERTCNYWRIHYIINCNFSFCM